MEQVKSAHKVGAGRHLQVSSSRDFHRDNGLGSETSGAPRTSQRGQGTWAFTRGWGLSCASWSVGHASMDLSSKDEDVGQL